MKRIEEMEDDDKTTLVNLINQNFQILLQWFNMSTEFLKYLPST